MLPWILGLAVAFAGQGKRAHGNEQWRTFHRMCGRLVSVQTIDRDAGKKVEEKWKSLKKVPLELYARGNEKVCCEGLSVTAKTVTGRRGDFDFRKLNPGTYWVVARWNDKVYQLPISFTPEPKVNTDCSLQGLSINSEGSFDRWTTIVLD